MPLLPVALYGLEVPCDGSPVMAAPEFPATFRITMAAIDPDETPANKTSDKNIQPRATLKIIREQDDQDSDDSEDEMNDLLAQSDSEDEDKNGGPSDPNKTKKARKAAAVKQLMDAIADDGSDEEMGDVPNGEMPDKKGKSKVLENTDDKSETSSQEDIDIEQFVVCTLDPKKNYQQTLDITIGENERVYFKVTGTHTVYLTGNYLITDSLGLGHNLGDDDYEEDDEYDLSPDEDELELDSDDEIDELDDLENPRITEVESEDEKVPKLVKASENKTGKNKRSVDEINNDNLSENTTSNTTKPTSSEEQKLSKKQLKKLKKNNGEALSVKIEDHKKDEEKTEKNDRKVQFAKNLEQGPSGLSDKDKTDQSSKPTKATLGVKNVDGIKIDDKKLGSGRPCKKGDKVSMRYIGKLVNGSVFDSNKKGTPFSFKLGTGEVIRGWDIGVTGMSAGGERRLTIPPNKGYGNKAMPGIPANSTLIFDIKMLEVK
ncbi:hypothetical protein HI914_01633 [Erysiphe necator]|nr:hypothetical protein HI914_01633 [Erysiphe necator]